MIGRFENSRGRQWELRPGSAYVDGFLYVRHAVVYYRRRRPA